MSRQRDLGHLILVQQRVSPQALEIHLAHSTRDVSKVWRRVVCRRGNIGRDDTLREEGVIHDFVKSGTFLRVWGQNLLDKQPSVGRDGPFSWKFILVITNSPGEKCQF
jgi:hypothetical protein